MEVISEFSLNIAGLYHPHTYAPVSTLGRNADPGMALLGIDTHRCYTACITSWFGIATRWGKSYGLLGCRATAISKQYFCPYCLCPRRNQSKDEPVLEAEIVMLRHDIVT